MSDSDGPKCINCRGPLIGSIGLICNSCRQINAIREQTEALNKQIEELQRAQNSNNNIVDGTDNIDVGANRPYVRPRNYAGRIGGASSPPISRKKRRLLEIEAVKERKRNERLIKLPKLPKLPKIELTSTFYTFFMLALIFLAWDWSSNFIVTRMIGTIIYLIFYVSFWIWVEVFFLS